MKTLESWPLLSALVEIGELSLVDISLARELLQNENSEALAALITVLSLISRRGHLCLKVEGQNIHPPLERLLTNPETKKTHKEIYKNLILKAVSELPSFLCQDVMVSTETVSRPLCHFRSKSSHFLYFQRHWIEESQVIQDLNRLEKHPPSIKVEEDVFSKKLEILVEKRILLPEQASAVACSCQQSLTLISGGPGTGKTYTAGWIIRMIWESMTPEQQECSEIMLAAPTGKAVANLQGSLERVIEGLEGLKSITAKTLHSSLKLRQGKTSATTPLSANIILVDESSMIDLRVLRTLLASVLSGSRLILLGDPNQLPPVESGSLFNDLIELCESHKNHVALSTCLRSDLQSIVNFSKAIKTGDLRAAKNILSEESQGIKRLSPETFTQETLVSYALQHFPKYGSELPSDQELLDAFNAFRLLSPIRHGPMGVETLNTVIAKRLMSKKHANGMIIAPLMIVSNDYSLKLFNGEVGVLIKPHRQGEDILDFKKGDRVIFSGDTETAIREFPALLLPRLELAYCLSIHKSQGSEFKHVLLLMPEGGSFFGREVLYTGVTRARKQVDLLCADSILEKIISQPSSRLSGLLERV
jgi:exodeoxyribonuclease V alpha subunit